MRKKIIITTIKFITFFLSWSLLIALVATFWAKPAFIGNNPAIEMLYVETAAFILVILCTLVYVLAIDKRKTTISISENPVKDFILGILIGCVWIGFPLLTFYLFNLIKFGAINEIPYLPLYIFALFLNVCMQEFLVRGYLFSLISQQFNQIIAMLMTTLLFTALHLGAFEIGLIAVLNVLTMSLLASCLQIYTGGLLAPILIHFIWNLIGGLIINAISIGAYPHLLSVELTSTSILSGGAAGLEGSCVTLLINLSLILPLIFLIRKKMRSQRTFKPSI